MEQLPLGLSSQSLRQGPAPLEQAGVEWSQIGSMLRFLLNVVWFVLGGVVNGLCWWLVAGLVAAITIVGIRWVRACSVIAETGPPGR